MPIVLEDKTEATLSASPGTVANPTGTSADDMLILIAATRSGSIALPGSAGNNIWCWQRINADSNLSVLVGIKRFKTGEAAPTVTNSINSPAVLYRYSGVLSVSMLLQTPVLAVSQDPLPGSFPVGAEILWVEIGTRGSGADAAMTLSRGSTETSLTVNRTHILINRETVGSPLLDVAATAGSSNTPDRASGFWLALTPSTGHIYKGRDSQADDDEGAA